MTGLHNQDQFRWAMASSRENGQPRHMQLAFLFLVSSAEI